MAMVELIYLPCLTGERGAHGKLRYRGQVHPERRAVPFLLVANAVN